MIEITKQEAQHLREVIPNVHIRRTVHKRYAEEIVSVLRELPDNVVAQERLKELTRPKKYNHYQRGN